MYQDTHPILTYGDDMTIECDQTGITLTSTYCECSFPVAYSTLSKLMVGLLSTALDVKSAFEDFLVSSFLL